MKTHYSLVVAALKSQNWNLIIHQNQFFFSFMLFIYDFVIVLLSSIPSSSITALWLIIIGYIQTDASVYLLIRNTRATAAIVIMADFLWWAKNCKIFMNSMICLVWRGWWTTCSTSSKLFIEDFQVYVMVFHLCTVCTVADGYLECNFGASSISNCHFGKSKS